MLILWIHWNRWSDVTTKRKLFVDFAQLEKKVFYHFTISPKRDRWIYKLERDSNAQKENSWSWIAFSLKNAKKNHRICRHRIGFKWVWTEIIWPIKHKSNRLSIFTPRIMFSSKYEHFWNDRPKLYLMLVALVYFIVLRWYIELSNNTTIRFTLYLQKASYYRAIIDDLLFWILIAMYILFYKQKYWFLILYW